MTESLPRISIVIPVFRSQEILGNTVAEIIDVVGESDVEIVLVDDGSPDDSWSVIRALANKHANIRGLRLYKNHGQHHAVLAGLSAARGEWIVTMDDDGQNPPSEIKVLIDAADNSDVVFGRFRAKHASGVRKLGSRLVRWLNIKIFLMPEDFHVSNFRLIHRDVVARIVQDNTAFPYITGQALIHSARPTWIWVDHRARASGDSGYTLSRIAGLLLNILFAYSVWPLRAAALVGFAMSALSLIAAVVYFSIALSGAIQVQGWATVVVLIAALGGVTTGMLAMLGEYIIRILTQSRGVAPFTVSERAGFHE